MYGLLNIDENKNYLYSLYVICETNFLSLVSPWLDNICQIQTKVLEILKFYLLNKALESRFWKKDKNWFKVWNWSRAIL